MHSSTAVIGAKPHERTDARTALRIGTRSKTITTALRQRRHVDRPTGVRVEH